MTGLVVNEDWGSNEYLKYIKQKHASQATEMEFVHFCKVAQKKGLDPDSAEIYCVSRGGRSTIQTSIHGLRKIAHRTGELAGMETLLCGNDGVWTDFWPDETKPPAAAKTIIYKKGSEKPFVAIAYWKEFNQGNSTWKQYPKRMLEKCSEAQAIRRAFSEAAGLYIKDEMPEVINENQKASVNSQVDKLQSLIAAKKEANDVKTIEVTVQKEKSTKRNSVVPDSQGLPKGAAVETFDKHNKKHTAILGEVCAALGLSQDWKDLHRSELLNSLDGWVSLIELATAVTEFKEKHG